MQAERLHPTAFFLFAAELDVFPVSGFSRGEAAEMFAEFRRGGSGGLFECISEVLAGPVAAL